LTHEWFTVVGVARDSKVNGLNEKPTPSWYLPLYQVYRAAMIINAANHGRSAGVWQDGREKRSMN